MPEFYTPEGTKFAVPKNFVVRPYEGIPENATGFATCGTCGLSWDDETSTLMTPVPGGRCPFEFFHPDETLHHFEVQTGYKSGKYKVRYSFDTSRTANMPWFYYSCVNVHSGYKKRLVCDGKVLARVLT